MIYFIRRPSDGAIKIGTTIRLSQRLQNHRSRHGKDLELLAVTNGDRKTEQSIHSRFHRLRIGIEPLEWFKPQRELIEYIAAVGRPWDGQDEATEVGPGVGYQGYCRPKDAEPIASYLPPGYRRQLRVIAATRGMSATALVCNILSEWIDANAEKSEGCRE